MKICSQSSSTYYSGHKSSNHSTILIDNWGLGNGPNENCSLIPGCADHHNDYDSGGDDHCGDSLWSQLSSPRAQSARAVTGRRCPHSGEGEDFLTGQLDFF